MRRGDRTGIWAVLASCVAVLSCPQPVSETFEVLVDCRYNVSVGWGNCYECTVKQVLHGAWHAAKVAPCVSVGSPGPQGAALWASQDKQDLVLSFRRAPERSHGPPSGFVSAELGYFVLIGSRSAATNGRALEVRLEQIDEVNECVAD